MGNRIVLYNLQKRNDSLKSLLIHDQLKYGTYHFGRLDKFLQAISEYKKLNSFFKVADTVDISQKELIRWYIQGQLGNPKFRIFYLAIRDINNTNTQGVHDEIPEEDAGEEISDDSIIEGGGLYNFPIW